MRDSATVVRIEKNMAWVQAKPRIACCNCSAMSLCAGNKDAKGLLAVRNPLRAAPGDKVEIEVPEASYARDLTRLFGLLLIGALAGVALGYFLSPLRGFSPNENGFFGILAGVFLCGFVIYHRYHRGGQAVGWPVIVEILDKGESHG